MTTVAVVAHTRKRLGGGLSALRAALGAEGVVPLWYEVKKSRKVGACVHKALAAGADRILVWGGDGTVRRAVDAAASSGVTIGILPAGTANLLATNLGIPADFDEALRIALHGDLRTIDVGVINGERFAVMAGTGLDARMIKEADRGLKDRVGQLAYVWTAMKAAGIPPQRVRVRVDDTSWFKGDASCVLLANVGEIGTGITAFEHTLPDDGLLEVGVVTASSRVQWARVTASMLAGKAEQSKLVRATRGRKIDIRLDHKAPYELDGGDRAAVKRLKVRVEPQAITICVPAVQ